ncbi:MAG: AAA-type ATPase lid domain-containing protein, partial [Bdellovibrionota bacterium]
GNIRELENAIERAFVMELSDTIALRSLPEQISGLSAEENIPDGDAAMISVRASGDSEILVAGIDFQQEKEEFERQFIINALKRFNGRINQTVAHANIPKNTLLRKIRKYDIKPFEFGADAHESEEMVPDETL